MSENFSKFDSLDDCMTNPQEKELLISFCDLSGFGKMIQKYDNHTVFSLLSEIYEIIGNEVAKAKGEVVKFVGDSALITFGDDDIDRSVESLQKAKSAVESFLESRDITSSLIVKAHMGTVVQGLLGTRENKQLDVIGEAVNVAALLPSQGFVLSAEVYKELNSNTQNRYVKVSSENCYMDKS